MTIPLRKTLKELRKPGGKIDKDSETLGGTPLRGDSSPASGLTGPQNPGLTLKMFVAQNLESLDLFLTLWRLQTLLSKRKRKGSIGSKGGNGKPRFRHSFLFDAHQQ